MKTHLFLCRLCLPTLLLLFLGPTGVAQGAEAGSTQAIVLGGEGPDSCKDVAMDDEGNAYVLGKFHGTATFGTGAHASRKSMGESDVFLAKYGASGACRWVLALGGSGKDEPGAIALDSDANAYVVGGFRGKVDFDPSESEATLHANDARGGQFLAKYDPEGKHVWSVHLQAGSWIEGNFGRQPAITDVAVDGAGNAYVIGWFQGVADLRPEGRSSPLKAGTQTRAYFARFNPQGECLWAQMLGERQCRDVPFNVSLGSGKVCFLTGESQGKPGTGLRTLVAAYKPNGKCLWVHRFVGERIKLVDTETYSETSQGGAAALSGAADSQDGIVIAGWCEGIVSFDPTGRKKRARMGAVGSRFGFVARYSKRGHLSWVSRTDPGGPFSHPRAVTVDAKQNVYATGQEGSNGFFVCAFSKTGKMRWRASSTGASAMGMGVAVDKKGNLALTGHFTGKMSLPETFSGILLMSSDSEKDGFLLRAQSDGEPLKARTK